MDMSHCRACAASAEPATNGRASAELSCRRTIKTLFLQKRAVVCAGMVPGEISILCHARPATSISAGMPCWTSLQTRLYYQQYRSCIVKFACNPTWLSRYRKSFKRNSTTCCGTLSVGIFGSTLLIAARASWSGNGSSTSLYRVCLIVFIFLVGVVGSRYQKCCWRTFGCNEKSVDKISFVIIRKLCQKGKLNGITGRYSE